MAKKQVIRLTEGDLHKVIKESVNKVLNEMSLHKGKEVYDSNMPWKSTSGFKWNYDGDRVDRYMYRLIKTAKDKNAVNGNGLPTLDYIESYLNDTFNYLTYDRAYNEVMCDVFKSLQNDDYTKEDLYQAIANAYYENDFGKELYNRHRQRYDY